VRCSPPGPDPAAAYHASGYAEKIIAERVGGTAASWGPEAPSTQELLPTKFPVIRPNEGTTHETRT
jgi:hypothetical protein